MSGAPGKTAGNMTASGAKRFDIEDSVEQVFAYFEQACENNQTDGLPVFPPTAARVQEMLRYTDRHPDDVVGIVAPRNGAATVEKIAINAVMTGCRPQYLPVLIAAVEAMVQPDYNLYGRQTTTHPGAHLLIVHGPIRNELAVNCRQNVFGHGWRANATLGRALRLIMINVGGNLPGVTDMATHGHPGRYSYCIGEDEENSPWSPFHVDRGLAGDTSAVTVMCAEGPHNVNDMVSKTPQLFLGSAASTMAHLGGNAVYRSSLKGEQMLVVTAEVAQWLSEKGWSKDDVRLHLYEKARQPVRALRDRGGWGLSPCHKGVDTNDDDAMVPIVREPGDILIVVAGGHGRHLNFIPTSGYNLSITRPITYRDGAPIRSVEDFLK